MKNEQAFSESLLQPEKESLLAQELQNFDYDCRVLRMMHRYDIPVKLEEQYITIQQADLPPGRALEMERQITTTGVYLGEITKDISVTGAVDAVKEERSGLGRLFGKGTLKIMPNAVEIPSYYSIPHKGVGTPPQAGNNWQPQVGIGPTIDPVREKMLSPEERKAREHDHRNGRLRNEADELGVPHEKMANFLYAAEAALNDGSQEEYDALYRDGTVFCKFIDRLADSEGSYAITGMDTQSDEVAWFRVVNLVTGDSLRVCYGIADWVHKGEYIADYGQGIERTISPRAIAQVAGFIETYGSEDPVVAAKQQGAPVRAEFTTNNQITRFGRLMSFDNTLYEDAQITFSPNTLNELNALLKSPEARYLNRVIGISVSAMPEADAMQTQQAIAKAARAGFAVSRSGL